MSAQQFDRDIFKRAPDFIQLSDGKLAYWRCGRGPDVVFVHGWPLHSATFRHLAPALAQQFTLHFFDLPGCGKSEWRGRHGLDANAAAVRAAVDKLRLERYALVGHDSGGASARLIAADDARVQALVLGNTEIPFHRPWLVDFYAWAARRPGLAALIFASLRWSWLRRSPLAFGGLFTDPAYVDGEFGALFVRPLLTDRDVARGQMQLLLTLDQRMIDSLPLVHAHIHAPVLCIWGPRDPFFPLAKARAMLPEFAGGASLVEIPDAKLFAHEDHAEEFAAAAAPFLARALRTVDAVAQM
jgi:pimeloyl-ACP methyl ester carboxylesterase